MTIFSSSRTFKIWEYQVSHSVLLLRSQKRSEPRLDDGENDPGYDQNVDVIFTGVERLSLPKILRGIHLTMQPTKNALYSYALDCSDPSIFVTALSCEIFTNDWDIFESPIEFRSTGRARPA